MSAKRSTAEASNDEQPNEGSDSVFQQQDIAKRAKLTLLSDTTLQDLPIELLEYILIKVVTMEVKGLKLAKSVWKEKADLVIDRLRTVSPQWSNILTTNFFRKEVHSILDSIAQETIRLEILHQSPIHLGVLAVGSLGDEIFEMRSDYGQGCFIYFYNRYNTAMPKDVIQLPRNFPESLAVCTRSTSIYLVIREVDGRSVMRLKRTGLHCFSLTPFISGLQIPVSTLAVSARGCLTMAVNDLRRGPMIRTYDTNGSLMNQIRFDSLKREVYSIESAAQKSNGNLIMVSTNHSQESQLWEIDSSGQLIRKYESYLIRGTTASLADANERVLLDTGSDTDLVLLDSELNPLPFTGQSLPGSRCSGLHNIKFSADVNELTSLVVLVGTCITSSLVAFRFCEE